MGWRNPLMVYALAQLLGNAQARFAHSRRLIRH